MPHGRGHRRVHSYFSGFTGSGAATSNLTIFRTSSTDQLHRANLGLEDSLRYKARSTHDITVIVTPEQDLGDLSQKRKKYNIVTLPSSIKYSVKQPDLHAMARPKSPKSKNGGDVSHQQMEDMLDQTLLVIRQQLNGLGSERAKMEQKMDDLTNGIREVCQQCQKYRQHYPRNTRRYFTPNTIRRISSATEGPFIHQTTAKNVPPDTQNNSNEPDGPVLSQEDNFSSKASTASTTSQESLRDSPVFRGSVNDSLNSNYSTCSLPNPRSKRAFSVSSASRNYVRVDSSLTHTRSTSLSLSQDEWVTGSVIHELPESPKFSNPGTPTRHTSKHNYSTPSLHYQSLTAPRSHSSSKKKLTTSTPHSMPTHSYMVTSSPDISIRGLTRQEHHLHPSHYKSHRTSLPDSVMNSVIFEDKVDSGSCCDSLSQLSTCTEEGSPKNNGSTIIMRRSSLTGQMEHIRRPRMLVKRNSSFGSPSEKQQVLERPRCGSACSIHDSSGEEYRVLSNRFRKSPRRKPVKILPSIETTV